MTYTFIGNKDYIETEISKILKDKNKENIITYDLEENTLTQVLEDLNTISLFGQKIVIVNNIDKITTPEDLIKYLEHESDNILILTNNKELDNRKKLTKILKEKTTYKELFKYDVTNYIKENLENYTMSYLDINMLINYCNNDISRIGNELEKLKIYKTNDKKITKEDIEKLVKKSYDSTIFNLIDSINNHDKEKMYQIYQELLLEKETDDKIIYTLANHYRLLYQIMLKIKKYKDDEIIKEYKFHPYRFSKLKEQTNLISEKEVLKILKNLGDIDIKIKTGKIDSSLGLVTFFENL